MQVTRCQVCQSETGIHHVIREMAWGRRDKFLYFECSGCGCLSLIEVPADPDRGYPAPIQASNPAKLRGLRKLRNAIYLSPLSFLVDWHTCLDLDVVRRVGLTKSMSLLDVNCGKGSLVGDLRELGYDAHGIDPGLTADVEDQFGIRVARKSLTEVESKYDVILFRHVLEHMPIDGLRLAREVVKDSGICVVCTPLLGWAWRTYSTDWAQLNAPRHRFLHTKTSFGALSQKSGFRVEKVIFDSSDAQLWASDSNQRGVSPVKMGEPTRSQRTRMQRLARSLNLNQQGDDAQFYLRPVERYLYQTSLI